MQVLVGSKLRNNDPRANGQIVTVIGIKQDGPAVNQQWAVYRGRARRSSIRFDKIVDINEPHHNHLWTLLPANGGADL